MTFWPGHQDAGAVSEALPAEAHLAPQRPAPEVRERRAQHSGAAGVRVKAGVFGVIIGGFFLYLKLNRHHSGKD